MSALRDLGCDLSFLAQSSGGKKYLLSNLRSNEAAMAMSVDIARILHIDMAARSWMHTGREFLIPTFAMEINSIIQYTLVAFAAFN